MYEDEDIDQLGVDLKLEKDSLIANIIGLIIVLMGALVFPNPLAKLLMVLLTVYQCYSIYQNHIWISHIKNEQYLLRDTANESV